MPQRLSTKSTSVSTLCPVFSSRRTPESTSPCGIDKGAARMHPAACTRHARPAVCNPPPPCLCACAALRTPPAPTPTPVPAPGVHRQLFWGAQVGLGFEDSLPPTPSSSHQVHWSVDWSSAGGNCKNDGGNVTIAPGRGGAYGTQVASCTGQALPLHATLYCQVKASASNSTSASDATTLQVQQTESAGDKHSYGPVVTKGCSAITYRANGKTNVCPECGQCCFA